MPLSLVASVRSVSRPRMCTPFRYVFTSGMPLPAASGSTKLRAGAGEGREGRGAQGVWARAWLLLRPAAPHSRTPGGSRGCTAPEATQACEQQPCSCSGAGLPALRAALDVGGSPRRQCQPRQAAPAAHLTRPPATRANRMEMLTWVR